MKKASTVPIMANFSRNSTILCVDDEPGVLEAYKKILEEDENEFSAVHNRLAARRRRSIEENDEEEAKKQSPLPEAASFRVLTASSGDEAIDIVRHELDRGRQIAVGFFDMLMPGGIDGQETIARIRKLDNQMLCAVVTAYTDRSPRQIGRIFNRQEDWLYFNKPFTIGELSQSALHLVSAWNRRRHEEFLVSRLKMMQKSLLGILNFVHDLNRIPPMLLDHLLDGILKHFLRLLEAKDGFIRLGDTGRVIALIGTGHFKEVAADTVAESGGQWKIAEEAIRNRKTVIVDHMAAVPLQVGTSVQGVIFVQQDRPFDWDLKLLEMFASQAVSIILNSQLYQEVSGTNRQLSAALDELQQTAGQLSKSEKLRDRYEKLTYYDVLTGLPNRRYLEVFFKQQLSRCRRKGNSLACLMIDIDNFKLINDRHGHIVGDLVLQELGTLLNHQDRGHEFVSRYGGEEFIILLENISPDDALNAAERIRAIVEEHTFNAGDQEVNTTISLGISVQEPDADTTATEIIEKADAALYEAKKRGRNCCVLAAH